MGFQPEYFPHSWADGKYYVVAKDATGKPVFRATAKNKMEGNRLYSELAAKYGADNVSAGKNVGLPEDVFFGLNPEAAAKVADTAIARLKGRGQVSEVNAKEIHEAIADTFKARGFGSHFIDRQNVQGFQIDNLREVLVSYANSAAGYIAKMDAAPRYFEHLQGIDHTETPKLYGFARNYVRDVLENSTRLDNSLGKMRGAIFHFFLGGVPKSAAINLSQNWVAYAPWMAKEGMQFPEVKIGLGVKDILKEWGAFRDLHKGGDTPFTSLTPGEGRALKDLFQNGALADYQTQELLGTLHGKGWGILNGALTASRAMFGTAENLNRTAAGLTSYRFYLNKFKGLGPEEAHVAAVAKAKESIFATHYLLGKYNLPEVARGTTGTAGKVFRSAGYSLKGFTHNYMEMMSRLIAEDPKAALRGIVNLSIMGSPLAVPIVNEAFALYRYITGTDPIEDGFKDKNDPAFTFIKYGLPGFLDTDIAQSVSPNLVMGSSPEDIAINAIGGPIASLALKSVPQAYDFYQRGHGIRSLEPVMPTEVRNILKGIRESYQGVTTKRGQEVYDPETGEQIKLTGREAVQQAVGFKPKSAAIASTERENVVRRQESRQIHQDILATRFLNALKNEDDAGMNKIYAEVDQYNEWAEDRGEPPIKIDDLVRERMKPKLPAKSWQPYIMQNRGE
jgi:hypothetical protein